MKLAAFDPKKINVRNLGRPRFNEIPRLPNVGVANTRNMSIIEILLKGIDGLVDPEEERLDGNARIRRANNDRRGYYEYERHEELRRLRERR